MTLSKIFDAITSVADLSTPPDKNMYASYDVLN